jgi:DNA polymerase III subunit beta
MMRREFIGIPRSTCDFQFRGTTATYLELGGNKMSKPGKTKAKPEIGGLFALTEDVSAPAQIEVPSTHTEHVPDQSLRIQINQKVLRAELDVLSEVVESKKSVLPFNHILIGTDGNRVTLQAAGPTNAIRCEADANVYGGGALCLPAIKFYDVVKTLSPGMLDLSGDGYNAVIKSGGSRIKINGIRPELFPELPTCQEFIVTIPNKVVSTLIHSTFFASLRDDNSGRYSLNGAQLTIGPDGIRMLATDGHRLSCIQRKDPQADKAVSPVISRDGLSAAAALIAHNNGEVKIGVDDSRIYFSVGTRQLSSLLLDKGYPNCEPQLSKNYQHQLTFDAVVFNSAINRMAVFGADRGEPKSGLITLQFATGVYEILGFNNNGGESRENVIPLPMETGGNLAINFNGRYLHDFARTLSGSSITIKYNDGNSPAEFCLADDEGEVVRYILMPVRL